MRRCSQRSGCEALPDSTLTQRLYVHSQDDAVKVAAETLNRIGL